MMKRRRQKVGFKSLRPAGLWGLTAGIWLGGAALCAANGPAHVGAFKDYKGSIHVHSALSHDSPASVSELISAANQADLDFVMLTDHIPVQSSERILDGFEGKTLFIAGCELLKSGKSLQLSDSLLLVGFRPDELPSPAPSLAQAVDLAHRSGGLAIAAHPLGFQNWEAEIDGMEIYDLADDLLPSGLDWTWKGPDYAWRALKLRFLNASSEDVLPALIRRPNAHLQLWDRQLQRRRIFGIGAPDAHQNMQILGRQVDPYAATLLLPAVHILAQELSREALIEALSQGRAYTGFDLLADSTGFEFTALSASNTRPVPQGSEVAMSPGLRLNVRVPAPQGDRFRVYLLRDGVVLQTSGKALVASPVEHPGVYRVEVMLQRGADWKQWIYSNPIYVRSKVP